MIAPTRKKGMPSELGGNQERARTTAVPQAQLPECKIGGQSAGGKLAISSDAVLAGMGEARVLAAAGNALPLLVKVVTECCRQRQGQCDLVLRDLAVELGCSGSTLTKWTGQLREKKLVTATRHRCHMTFAPVSQLLPSASAAARSAEPASSLSPAGAQLQEFTGFVLQDLMARLRVLEQAVYAKQWEVDA